MNWAEFYQYIKPIADRRGEEYLPVLWEVAIKWEQEKIKQEEQGKSPSDVVSPFKHIESYSPYLGIAVYSYLRNAMQKGQRTIRLGPTKVEAEPVPNSSDDFSYPGGKMIPYFLESVRFDELLAEHLEITREQEVLIVTINAE